MPISFFMEITFADILIFSYIFILGAVFGSFFNVVIYRVPQQISIVKGHSFCPDCHSQIVWYDLVPILSFIFLGGKCRSCGRKISLQYPLIEALYGIVYVVFALKYGFTLVLPLYFAMTSILIAIAFIDIETSTIPDSLLIALVPFIIGLSLIDTEVSLLSRFFGALIICVPMFALTLFIENAFGGGDMKLIALCGFALGFRCTVVAAFIAFLLGGIYAFYLLIKKKASRKATMPFGQFLVLGVLISMLYGNFIADFYLRLL